MDSNSFTVTVTTVVTDDEVTAVTLTGVSFAHPETIRDLAQEAIDSTYGSVSHKRVAIFTHEMWQNMRHDEPDEITIPVHTFA